MCLYKKQIECYHDCLGEYKNCINYLYSPNIIYNNFVFDTTEIETNVLIDNNIDFEEI